MHNTCADSAVATSKSTVANQGPSHAERCTTNRTDKRNHGSPVRSGGATKKSAAGGHREFLLVKLALNYSSRPLLLIYPPPPSVWHRIQMPAQRCGSRPCGITHDDHKALTLYCCRTVLVPASLLPTGKDMHPKPVMASANTSAGLALKRDMSALSKEATGMEYVPASDGAAKTDKQVTGMSGWAAVRVC